jgi:hypothetical protein
MFIVFFGKKLKKKKKLIYKFLINIFIFLFKLISIYFTKLYPIYFIAFVTSNLVNLLCLKIL